MKMMLAFQCQIENCNSTHMHCIDKNNYIKKVDNHGRREYAEILLYCLLHALMFKFIMELTHRIPTVDNSKVFNILYW